MVIDSNLYFAKDQAITASAVSTILDGKKITDMGRGNPVYLNIYVTTIFTSTTANQLTIQLISSSGADPGASDVFVPLVGPRSSALLQQTGLIYRAPLPVGIPYERVGLYFLATTALAAGKITAFLSLGGDVDQVLTT